MKSLIVFTVVLLLAACGSGSGTAPISPAPVPSGFTAISVIQGAGSASSIDNQAVSIAGVVTGDFQDNDADTDNNLGGFYVQQESPDTDPATSEGIFVFDGSNPATDVSVGDRVEVTGTVAEYFGETQVTAATVSVTGSGTIQVTDINFPAAALTTTGGGEPLADLERFEGMLVRFPQQLSVSSLRFLERFGELGLSQGGRLYQFTNSNLPDIAAYAAHQDATARRSIILDDGRRSFYPS